MRANGFTLIEVLVAGTMLALVLGLVLQLSMGIGDTAEILSAKATADNEAYRAQLLRWPQFMLHVPVSFTRPRSERRFRESSVERGRDLRGGARGSGARGPSAGNGYGHAFAPRHWSLRPD